MGRPIDHEALVGRAFNDWTVLSVEAGARTRYRVRCRCGSVHSVDAASVRSGTSKRCKICGDRVRGPQNGHGATRGRRPTPEFNSWRAMIERCTNENHASYARYGGRGITVYPPWLESFAFFLADVGPKPSPEYSLDRFPNTDGNYEPGNVRWATDAEQGRNKSTTRRVRLDGEELCLTDAARRLGMTPASLHERLQRGTAGALGITEGAAGS